MEHQPLFKFTSNEKRMKFIEHSYPFRKQLLQMPGNIHKLEFDINDKLNVIHVVDNTTSVNQIDITEREVKDIQYSCSNTGSYRIIGGAVFELLNMKYNKVDLFKYTDLTNDIDVAVILPEVKITTHSTELQNEFNSMQIRFYDIDNNTINNFYRNYINWYFKGIVEETKTMLQINPPTNLFVEFDINEYKIHNMGDRNNISSSVLFLSYKIENIYVIGFFNPAMNNDNADYRFQIVCKYKDNNVEIIDHMLEFIIPLPNVNSSEDDDFNPISDSYSPSGYDTIEIDDIKYITRNIYSEVGPLFDAMLAWSDTKPDFYFKEINYTGRFLYLLELIYKYPDEDLFPRKSIIFYDILHSRIRKLRTIRFYRYTTNETGENEFNICDIDLRFIFNSYIKIKDILYKPGGSNRDNIVRTYHYFNEVVNPDELHDKFIERLFDTDALPENLLTFQEEGQRKITDNFYNGLDILDTQTKKEREKRDILRAQTKQKREENKLTKQKREENKLPKQHVLMADQNKTIATKSKSPYRKTKSKSPYRKTKSKSPYRKTKSKSPYVKKNISIKKNKSI